MLSPIARLSAAVRRACVVSARRSRSTQSLLLSRSFTTHNNAEVLKNAVLNRGTAFTLEEREKYGISGLLPPTVETLDRQLRRVKEQFNSLPGNMEKYIYLHALKGRNETLFFAFLLQNMKATLPVIYTPTVGEACLKMSHVIRSGSGMYITKDFKGKMRKILDNWHQDVSIIVVTDGSRILGLGDLGANGMGIPVGKLSLYVAAAGFNPANTLPICLDFGTNNADLLKDELYIGEKYERLPEEEYRELIDEFLMAVNDKWPKCLLQFEDFSNNHCFDLLRDYRNKMLCFNDDIQGTGAVVASGFATAAKFSQIPFLKQRIVFYGAGSAAVGVAEQIAAIIERETGVPVHEIRKQFWFVDSRGLVTKNRGDKLEVHKLPFAREDVSVDKQLKTLVEVVKAVKPTALFGLSTQTGAFTPEILTEMGKNNEKPIVFSLSNPTSKSECSAADAYKYTEGRALFASGSPYEPVTIGQKTLYPTQANNMYIFPGVGFGSWLCKASKVTDEMITTATLKLATCVTEDDLAQGSLYPSLDRIRDITAVIAAGVIETAIEQGVARIMPPKNTLEFVKKSMWWPRYHDEPLK